MEEKAVNHNLKNPSLWLMDFLFICIFILKTVSRCTIHTTLQFVPVESVGLLMPSVGHW